VVASLVLALALAPWSHPLGFRPLAGWETGRSGTTASAYFGGGTPTSTPLESAAWIARGVRYRDRPTADPPNETLRHLPPGAVIVWAVIISPVERNQRPIRLTLAAAKRFDCCEAVPIPGGEYELGGTDASRSYSVIVRTYFGSKPTRAMRARAQQALSRIELPPMR
jgi:hypothetical protein